MTRHHSARPLALFVFGGLFFVLACTCGTPADESAADSGLALGDSGVTSATDSGAPGDSGTLDSTTDSDVGDSGGTAGTGWSNDLATFCTLSPALADDVDLLHVGPDREVYLGIGAALVRYLPTDAGVDCTLEQDASWSQDPSLTDIHHFDVDDAGNLYVSQSFSVVRLDPTGQITGACDAGSVQGMAVSADGEAVLYSNFGDLETVGFDEAGCTTVEEETAVADVDLQDLVDWEGRYAVGTTTYSGDLEEPLVVVDMREGVELRRLGKWWDVASDGVCTDSDLYVRNGWAWVADTNCRDVMGFSLDGRQEHRIETNKDLPLGDRVYWNVEVDAVGGYPDGEVYAAGGESDLYTLWRLTLPY